MAVCAKIPRKDLIGYTAAISALILSSLSAAFVQALEAAVPDFELSVARSIMMSLVSLLVSRATGASITVNEQYLPALIVQGVCYTMFVVEFFGATNYIPLIQTVGLMVIASIATSILHAWWIYNREITKSVVASFCIAVIGIMLTVQPGWIFPADQSHVPIGTTNSTASLFAKTQLGTVGGDGSTIPGFALGIVSGISWGLQCNIASNLLNDIKPIVQVFYFAVTSTVLAAVVSLYCEQPVLVLDTRQYLLVLLHCVFSVSALGGCFACYYIGGTRTSLVYALEVVTMAIWQYTLMTQIMPGHRNVLGVVGCFTIVLVVGIVPAVDLVMHNKGSDQLP